MAKPHTPEQIEEHIEGVESLTLWPSAQYIVDENIKIIRQLQAEVETLRNFATTGN